jgi:hypothetical protein
MDLRTEIIPYRDAEGFILPKKWNGTVKETENGLMYSGIYYLMLEDVTVGERDEFIRLVDSCSVEKNGTKYTGVYHRNPGQADNLNGHDDVSLVSAASAKLDTLHKEQIYCHGKDYNWSYNNTDPAKWTFRSWHFRHPNVITQYYRSVGMSRNIFWNIVEFLTIIFIGTYVPGHMMTWARLKTSPKTWYYNILKRIWIKRITSKYGSIRNMFADHFGTEHPLVKFCKETLD